MAENMPNFMKPRAKQEKPAVEEKSEPEQEKHQQRRYHDRARHTLYLDKTTIKRIDQAFRETAHEVYPQEVTKADYLEACLKFALAHPDQVKIFLLSAISDN